MFLKVGHRGAKAYEPENTLRSFNKALELGANAIEIDARLTKDENLVCMHDEKLEKTTNGAGLVTEHTLNEIKKLDAGKGEKVPTLEEALKFIGKKAKILIDLRSDAAAEQVLKLIQKLKLVDNTILISSKSEILKRTKKLEPKIETGMWYVKHPNPLETALEIKLNYLKPIWFSCHSDIIKKSHENGIKVLTWVVNEKSKAQEFVKKGIDGIVTDKPDILKDL